MPLIFGKAFGKNYSLAAGGGSVESPAPPPPPPPPPPPGGETLVLTETRQNQTASTVDKAPVSFVAAFSDGVVASSDTLVLRDGSDNLIPTTHWQWNERSSYPSGYLRSCVVSCLSPSMASGATATWKVLKTTGSRPAETNARTTANISGTYDWNVRLTNAVTVNNTGTLYATRGSGAFSCSANTALGTSVTVKEHAGPVRTKWWTWGKFLDEVGGAADINLWCEFEIDEWVDPDSGNAVHVHVTPRARNGWARSTQATYLPVVYQCQLRNGVTVVHDYSYSATYQPADVSGTNIASSEAKLPWANGNAVRFSANCPSNLTVDKWYAFYAWDSPTRLSSFSITPADVWSGAASVVSFSAATGSFTATTGIFHGAGRLVDLVNEDGGEHVILGQPLLYPAWDTDQKRARMDAGLFLPTNLQIAPRTLATNNYTYAKPAIGGCNYHRPPLDQSGGHAFIGDMTFWFADALREMTASRIRRARMSGMEIGQAAFYGRIMSDEINPATGVEYATITPLNNGPNDSGTAYTGLPLGQPLARIIAGAPWYFSTIGTAGGNDLHPGLRGGIDGSHMSAGHQHDWAMFGTTRYLKVALAMATASAAWWLRDKNALGNNRGIGARNYYCVHSLGNCDGQGRSHGQISHMLSAACYLADWRPERAYVDDIVQDNIDYLVDAVADGSHVDAVTLRLGVVIKLLNGGAEQHWFNARTQHGTLALLKRSGVGTTENRDMIVEWFTNLSMLHGRASRTGVNFGFLKKAWAQAQNTGDQWYWLVAETTGRDIRGSTGNVSTEADPGFFASAITFNGDNTITLTTPGNFPNSVPRSPLPADGDVFVLPNEWTWPAPVGSPSVAPPSGVSLRTKYWIYDVTGSGATRTAKISSTQGPGYTQVTWTGSTVGYSYPIWPVLQNDPTGPNWGPDGWNADSFGYTPHNAMPLACAFRWFGKADCEAPLAAMLSGPFVKFTGGYAMTPSNAGAPQNQIDTQIICDV